MARISWRLKSAFALVSLLLLLLLTACSTDPPAPDGALDCPTNETWVEQGSVLPGTVGLSSPEAALEEALSRFQRELGGEIVVGNGFGSVVVDGSETVLAHASEMPAGGWLVLTISGCGPYEG